MNAFFQSFRSAGSIRGMAMFLLVGFLLSIGGCSSMVTISPSTTPITADDTYTKLGHATGRAFGVNILGILPLSEPHSSQTARDAAIKNGGGNALIEVTEDYTCIGLIVVYFSWTTVEGTAVQVQRKGMEVE